MDPLPLDSLVLSLPLVISLIKEILKRNIITVGRSVTRSAELP